jgi:peptidoglycan-N-acetylglucosamine deacetylase
MPYASLSLDLDDRWSYLKTHGDPAWIAYPSYLDVLVPRVLQEMARRNWTITLFLVGRDAADPRNAATMRAIGASPHGLGNHSYRHEPWLHRYHDDDVAREIGLADEAIAAATGRSPSGFRGPGFSCTQTTLEVLAKRGYAYDASRLPTFIGPLARAYYFATSSLTRDELRRRAELFGSFRDGLRPLRAHFLPTKHGPILEIPVTTFPLVRTPIHLSYVLYLARWSFGLARSYFTFALDACRIAGVPPSILLHPLDFLGRDDVADLDFFPAMDLPRARKLAYLRAFLDILGERFTIVTMAEHAQLARDAAQR